MVAAPHTSAFDAVLMFCIAWSVGFDVKWLGKKSLMKPPLGWITKPLGGIAVDRGHAGGMVQELVDDIEKRQAEETSTSKPWALVIAPEGTRRKTDHWKSGFYRIAMETGLPVILGFGDRRNRTVGLGPLLQMTGDPRADMDRIREFYKGIVGVKPGKEGTPRLRMEGEESK